MCDYSLHHVNSRPAKIGDRLNLMPKRFIFLWTIPLFFSTSLYAQPQDASPRQNVRFGTITAQ